MNRKFKQVCLRLAVVILMAVAVPFQSFAANAKIAFSDPSAQVGGEVSVTMKFTSTSGEVLGNTNVMLAYDANMLEYVGGSENVNGGSGALRVTSGMEGKTEIASTLKFKALQAGSTQITVSSWEGYDEDGQMLTLDKQGSSSITITAPASYSSDASLKSLEVSPGVLTPAFDPAVESYTVTVGLDTEKLTVSAPANSDKAAVAVEGGTELQPGDNTVVCRVTAEDGTTVKNYTITVSKVEGGETAAAGETQPAAGTDLEVLAQLEAAKTPFKLGITALPEGVSAPAELKESTITIGDTKVQGWIPQTDGQPEYCVLYGVSESGAQGFYRYDMADRTIQRYFQGGADAADPNLVDVAQKYNDLVDDYGMVKWIAIAAMAFAVILLIALIVTLTMASKRNRGGRDSYGGRPEPEKRASKPSRGAGSKKLSKEERYMMGEEDEYEEEDYDSEAYLPEQAADLEETEDLADEADPAEERIVREQKFVREPEFVREPRQASVDMVPVDAVELSLEAKLAREAAAAAAAAAAEMPEAADEEEDDDFEVFDLDDEK